MPPRRYITLLSAFVHAAILSTVFVTQLLSPGPLPIPRTTVLAFSDAMPAQLKDIPLPPPPRGSSPAAAHTFENAAPVIAPRDSAPETGRENTPSTRLTTDLPGVEAGVVGGIDLPGQGLRVEPPAPPPPPREPMRLHSGMQTPRKLVHVSPRYPPTAQAARVEGLVVLDAVIDATGRVNDLRVTRSIPLLDQAAIDAVRQWRFSPTLLNGEPVSILLTVTVRFTLGPS